MNQEINESDRDHTNLFPSRNTPLVSKKNILPLVFIVLLCIGIIIIGIAYLRQRSYVQQIDLRKQSSAITESAGSEKILKDLNTISWDSIVEDKSYIFEYPATWSLKIQYSGMRESIDIPGYIESVETESKYLVSPSGYIWDRSGARIELMGILPYTCCDRGTAGPLFETKVIISKGNTKIRVNTYESTKKEPWSPQLESFANIYIGKNLYLPFVLHAIGDQRRKYLQDFEQMLQNIRTETRGAKSQTAKRQSMLTVEAIENGEYIVGVGKGKVKFKEGVYEWYPPEPLRQMKSTVRIRAFPNALADLNKDGREDAVVVFYTTEGGTGIFPKLRIITLDNYGKPSEMERPLLSFGDREQIESITLDSDEIIVTMLTHSPNDGLCCPTVKKVRKFIFFENEFIEI